MRGLVFAVTSVLTGALATTALADSRADADEHAKRGIALYKLGKYEDAIAEFESAYQEFQSGALLFNLAQAHRKLEHCDRALDYYHQFLVSDPSPELKEQVEKLLPELQAACRMRDARPTGPAPADAERTQVAAAPKAAAPDASASADADAGSDAPAVELPTWHFGAAATVGEVVSGANAPVTGVAIGAQTVSPWSPHVELGGMASVANLWRYTSADDALIAQLGATIEYRADRDWGRWTVGGALGAEYVSRLGMTRDVIPGSAQTAQWTPFARAELGVEHDVAGALALRGAASFAIAPPVGALATAVGELDLVVGLRYAR